MVKNIESVLSVVEHWKKVTMVMKSEMELVNDLHKGEMLGLCSLSLIASKANIFKWER
jgi:hypothetical protein